MSMSLGLGLGLTHRRGASLAALIRALFRNGEAGAWLDPSDSTTLFQDAAGTTPAGIGDPVRLIRDKSGNENDALAPSDAARPVVGRVPVTGRRNLLDYSETLIGNWNTGPRGGSVIAAAALTESRGHQMYEFTSDASDIALIEPARIPIGQHTVTLEVSTDDVQFVGIDFDGSAANRAVFNLQTLVVTDTGTGVTASINSLGGNIALITATFTTSVNGRFRIAPRTEAYESGGIFQTIASGQKLRFGRVQYDAGASATAFQQTRSQFDVTEAGVASAIYIRRDLNDDQIDVTLPAITDGKIIIGTTEGVWVDDLDFAGGTFSLGPTTYTGGPVGLYDAIGADELGTIILDRQPTEAELANIMKWFKSKGSPDNLITEPF